MAKLRKYCAKGQEKEGFLFFLAKSWLLKNLNYILTWKKTKEENGYAL
jgi:hypothetical protein